MWKIIKLLLITAHSGKLIERFPDLVDGIMCNISNRRGYKMFSDNHILLYDGVCIMCNRLINFIIKKDKKEKFRFAPLQSISRTLINIYNLPEMEYFPFMFIKGGKVYMKSTAILMVMEDLGGFWQASRIFKLIPGFIRDSVYDYIAKRRYRIRGRLNECPVPLPEIRNRFFG